MSNQAEKTVMSKLTAKVMAILKLDEAGKVEKFFKNEVKRLNDEIKTIEMNKKTAELEFEMSLKQLEDKIEDAEAAIQEAYENVKLEDINNNEAMNSFSRVYWVNIDRKESDLETLLDAKKNTIENYEKALKARNEKIEKRKAKIEKLA